MRIFYLSGMTLLLCACSATKNAVTTPAYRDWLKSNTANITDTLSVNDVFFALREYPYDLDYLDASADSREDLRTAQKEVQSRHLLRYALKIILPAPTDIYHYQLGEQDASRAEYYAFQVKSAFKLVTKTNDTIGASRVFVEQAISGSPNSLVLIEFEGLERKKAAKILFDDQYLSRSVVRFNISQFSNVTPPQLSIQ